MPACCCTSFDSVKVLDGITDYIAVIGVHLLVARIVIWLSVSFSVECVYVSIMKPVLVVWRGKRCLMLILPVLPLGMYYWNQMDNKKMCSLIWWLPGDDWLKVICIYGVKTYF